MLIFSFDADYAASCRRALRRLSCHTIFVTAAIPYAADTPDALLLMPRHLFDYLPLILFDAA